MASPQTLQKVPFLPIPKTMRTRSYFRCGPTFG